jgi:hypothetical protein
MVCSLAIETGGGDRIPAGGGRTTVTGRSSLTGGADSGGQLATGAGVLGAARRCAPPGSDGVTLESSVAAARCSSKLVWS